LFYQALLIGNQFGDNLYLGSHFAIYCKMGALLIFERTTVLLLGSSVQVINPKGVTNFLALNIGNL